MIFASFTNRMLRSAFIFSILFTTFVSQNVFAKTSAKYLFYIGGGETVSQNPKATNFDYSFSHLRNLEKEDWKARYLFAGDQTNSKRLRLEVGERSQTLTNGNLTPFLENIEKTILSGALDHGQLMIYLDTHGIMDDGKYTISTTDGTYDILPSLLKIRGLAKARNIKLGIIGATCFSGQLMNLEDQNTCVITTAPSDTVGLMMNNNVIAYLLGHHTSKNLEDLHLQSRKFKDIDLGQPMISTPAGKKAFEVLKELRTTVLVAGKKSAPEIHSCDQNGVEKTLAQISLLLQGPENSVSSTHTKAENSVGNATASRDNLVSSSVAKIEKRAPFISDKLIGKLKTLDLKLKSLLGQHREELISNLTNSCQSLNPDLKENPPCDLSHKSVSERNTSTMEEQGIVLKPVELPKDLPQDDKPDAAQVTFAIENASKSPAETLAELVKTSAEIGAVERDLYDLLYKKFSEETPAPNICNSFPL